MIGPYRLLGRLGAGGMGQVYLARSPGGRGVAVKVIRPELTADGEFRSRFAREVAAVRRVSGIFTAPVIDADPEADVPWMATAYVPGPSLAAAIDEEGPLPTESVLALGAGLAEGLQSIHAAGIVHRDLKPSNVLLAADGPRVIDFGISRAAERSMLTTVGVVLGSPGFMSPEQALGRREIGSPADIFSLGAILAFANSGMAPFGHGPVPTLMYRVVHEEPDLSGVSAEVRALIEPCLAKDPDARPTTGHLLRDLGQSVDLFSPDWLPEPVAATLTRYTPTSAGHAAQAELAQAPRPDAFAGTATRAAVEPAAGSPEVAQGNKTTPAVLAPAQDPPVDGPDDGQLVGGRRRRLRPWLITSGAAAAIVAAAAAAALVLSSPSHAKPSTELFSSKSPTRAATVAPLHPTASPSLTDSPTPKASTSKRAETGRKRLAASATRSTPVAPPPATQPATYQAPVGSSGGGGSTSTGTPSNGGGNGGDGGGGNGGPITSPF
jgi:hypothetical protein